MDKDDIQLIEKRLNRKLPQAYIDVITNYPKELLETDAQDYGLLDDAKILVRENLNVRKVGYFGEEWPDNYLIIGLNGCGDYYVTLLDSEKFTVGFADHEQMECREFAGDLSEFITKYRAELEM